MTNMQWLGGHGRFEPAGQGTLAFFPIFQSGQILPALRIAKQTAG